jgi:hypothetical protein
MDTEQDNPYKSPIETDPATHDRFGCKPRTRYGLGALLCLLALLVPVNCASLLFVAAAVESPSLNVTVARSVFAVTALAFLVVLILIPVVMLTRGNSR